MEHNLTFYDVQYIDDTQQVFGIFSVSHEKQTRARFFVWVSERNEYITIVAKDDNDSDDNKESLIVVSGVEDVVFELLCEMILFRVFGTVVP